MLHRRRVLVLRDCCLMRWVGLLRLALLCMLGVRRGKMRFGMDLLVLLVECQMMSAWTLWYIDSRTYLVAVSVAQHT